MTNDQGDGCLVGLGLAGHSSEHAGVAASTPLEPVFLGASAIMRDVARQIERVAPTAATVLVRGETGTGKDVVARAIHHRAASGERPFVKVDCASLPEALLESELFGHEKGAFTGAAARKLGRAELAAGGTLFLDEIGELAPATQAKLLRLLQDREFERLGGTQTIRASARVIAATHRDLETMVEHGDFREDLFYRLNVVPIWLPPLRARRADIAGLAELFCREAAERNARHVCLAPEALAELTLHRWPGNVRQLSNFIERLVVLSEAGTIAVEQVRREIERRVSFATESAGPDASGRAAARAASISASLGNEHLSEAVRDAERQALLRALDRVGGKRDQAARLLGVSRSTFYAKLKQYGLL